jgi:FkbM family methyltransferase
MSIFLPLSLYRTKLKHRLTKRLHTYLYDKAYSRAFFTMWGLAFREVQVGFSQFFYWRSPIISLGRAIKYTLLGVLRILWGRAVKQSYGYTGEDRLLESLLKKKITYRGYYVDIGCNDPRFLSNTFLFYRRGWTGLCVDANEKVIKKFKQVRPKDIALNYLISDDESTREFYEMTNNVLSTTEEMFLPEYIRQGQKITSQRTVQPRSLTKVLDEYNIPNNFDLLSIDTEEHDLQVLQSLDFSRYTPSLIVIEAEDFNAETPGNHPIFQFLKAHHYNFEGSILKNLYFKK